VRFSTAREPAPDARGAVQKDLEHGVDHARRVTYFESLADEGVGQHAMHALYELAERGTSWRGDECVVEPRGEGYGCEAVRGLVP
jgi:hypothetical protein